MGGGGAAVALPATAVTAVGGMSRLQPDGCCGPSFGATGAPTFGECDPHADNDQKGQCCRPSSGWQDHPWG